MNVTLGCFLFGHRFGDIIHYSDTDLRRFCPRCGKETDV